MYFFLLSFIIILIFYHAYALNLIHDCKCKVKLKSRILNANVTHLQYPWQAAIILFRKNNISNSNYKYYLNSKPNPNLILNPFFLDTIKYEQKIRCGATIINERFLLSAAHCFSDENNLNFFFIGVGKNDYTEMKRRYRIRQIHYATAFDNKNLENDLCLIELNENLPINQDIQPGCFEFNHNFNTKTKYTIASFGSIVPFITENNIKLLETVSSVKLKEINYILLNKKQNNSLKTINLYSEKFGNSLCTGDSGSFLGYTKNNKFRIVGELSTVSGYNIDKFFFGCKDESTFVQIKYFKNFFDKIAKEYCQIND